MGNFFEDIGDKLESAWDKVEAQAERSWDDVREFNYKAIPYLQAVGQFIPHPYVQAGVGAHSALWGGYGDNGGDMPSGQAPVLNIDPRYGLGGFPLGVAALPQGPEGQVVGGNWVEEPTIFSEPWIKKNQNMLLIGGVILGLYLIT